MTLYPSISNEFNKNNTIQKKVLAAQLILLEQNKLLMRTKNSKHVQLIATQNLALNLFVFMQNNLEDNYHTCYSLSNFIKKEVEKLSETYTKEYTDIPYCIIDNFLYIKKQMTRKGSSFDNKPEDIDAVLESLRTGNNLSQTINKLDQFTRSYLSEAGWKFLVAFYSKQSTSEDTDENSLDEEE